MDFRPQQPGPKHFDVSGKRRPQPALKKREKFRLLLLLGTTFAFLVVWLANYSPAEVVLTEDDTVPQDLALDNAQPPDLSGLSAFPTQEALVAVSDKVAALERDPGYCRLYLKGADLADPLALAWARQRLKADREEAIVPRGYASTDIGRGAIRSGDAILFEGTLVDLAPVRFAADGGGGDTRSEEAAGAGGTAADAEAWYRIVLALPNHLGDDQYVLIQTPIWATAEAEPGGDKLSLGVPTRVVGRFMGNRDVPGKHGEQVRMPYVVASRVRQEFEESAVSALGLAQIGAKTDESHKGVFRADPTIFNEIDDILPVLEIRPYYYLLGQVRLDASTPGVYDEAIDGNLQSPQIHLDPDAYRGTACKVDGYVWDAWEDVLVERDKPYDIRKVHRIRFYKRLFNVPHKMHDIEGRESVSTRSMLHAYEVAAIVPGDRALPERGDEISFTGRFLKVHGYPIEPNPMKDRLFNIRRQSDNAYFKFFVAPSYESRPRPAPPSLLWWGLGFVIIALSFLGCMTILIRRDERRVDDYKRNVRRLRESRRQLKKAKRADAAAAEDIGATDSGSVAAGTELPSEAPED